MKNFPKPFPKLWMSILSLLLCFSCLYVKTTFSRCGDVDGDGNIYSNDVLMVARASIGMLTLTPEQKLRTDVVVSSNQTPDGQIFSNDLLIIARASLGMVTPLCNENCQPHTSKSCYSGDVYWYNSCSIKEELYQDCGANENCIDAQCVERTCQYACCSDIDCATALPYCVNPNTSSSQCVQCTANSHCQSGYNCQSNTCTAPQPANNSPVVTSTAATIATVGLAYSYDVNATDADGDTLTYSLTTATTGMTINSTTGVISWTPAIAGAYNITVSVSDGKDGTANQNFIISVNGPPVSVTLSNPTDITTNSLVLLWTQNNDTDFASYKIYKSTTSEVNQDSTLIDTITTKSTTTKTAADLSASTTYYFKVYICDTGSLCTPSNEVSGTTLNAPPVAVTLSEPTAVTDSSLVLSWTQNSDDDFARYEIRKATATTVLDTTAAVSIVMDKTTLTKVISSLAELTNYHFKVYICDTGSLCTGSNEVSATTGNAPPRAVTLLEATDVSTSSFNISWTQNNDADFAYYKLHWSFTSGITETSNSLIPDTYQLYTSTPLTGGQSVTYYFKIQVCDTGQLCSWSNEISVTTANTQPTPVTLFEATNVSTSTLTLSWTQSIDSDFSYYKAYASTTPGVNEQSWRVATETEKTKTTMGIINTIPATIYYFKIKICDNSGLCSWSNEISVTTLNTAPSAITLNTPTNITTSTMNLAWSQNPDTDFASYKIYYSPIAAVSTSSTLFDTITSQTTTTKTVTGLYSSATYYFKVYICDTGSLCTPSNEVSATTLTAYGNISGRIYVPKESSLGIFEKEPNNTFQNAQYIDWLTPGQSFKMTGLLDTFDTDDFWFMFSQDMYVTYSIDIAPGYTSRLSAYKDYSTTLVSPVNISGSNNIYSGNVTYNRTNGYSYFEVILAGYSSGLYNYSITITTEAYRYGSRILTRPDGTEKTFEDPNIGDVSRSTPEGVNIDELLKQKLVSVGALQPETKSSGEVVLSGESFAKFESRTASRQTVSIQQPIPCQDAEHVWGQVIVKAISSSAIDRISQKYNLKKIKDLPYSLYLLTKILEGQNPINDPAKELCLQITNEPDVEYVELNYIQHAMSITPNDTYYNKLWGLKNIRMPDAWEIATGSSNISVAVLDTGYLLNNDLYNRLDLVNDKDFVSCDEFSKTYLDYSLYGDCKLRADGDGVDSDAYDEQANPLYYIPPTTYNQKPSSFHGTHVAGTIGAIANNGYGVTGVDWNSKIIPIRVLGVKDGNITDRLFAMSYISTNRLAKVMNMSLGNEYTGSEILCTDSENTAFAEAEQSGIVSVVAAGNDSSDFLSKPANCNYAIAVGALNKNNFRTTYSNYDNSNRKWHYDVTPGSSSVAGIYIMAPGGEESPKESGILSAYYLNGFLKGNGTDYFEYAQGTSMAAPHVSGVVSLMFSIKPDLTPAQVREILCNTADMYLWMPGSEYGCGILNAYEALKETARRAGRYVAGNPIVSISTDILNFGVTNISKSLSFTVTNPGSGTLIINSVYDTEWNGGNWLTGVYSSLPNTTDGKVYTYTANPTGLVDGPYGATITISTSVGTKYITVYMYKATESDKDMGTVGVAVINANYDGLATTTTTLSQNYNYQINYIPVGDYYVLTCNDADNNGHICEDNDAKGIYLMQDNIRTVTIQENQTISNINFYIIEPSQTRSTGRLENNAIDLKRLFDYLKK